MSEKYVFRPGRSGKGTGERGPMPKGKRQKFLTMAEFQILMDAVQADRKNKNRERDFHILFCGFYFGLRVSECALLTRNAFRFIDSSEARIPTLKQEVKIRVFCPTCDKFKYFSADREETSVSCQCGAALALPKSKIKRNGGDENDPVEYSPPAVEEEVYVALRRYLDKLPKSQEFLFESAHGPMHKSSLNNIFNKYACKAGLDRRYCWHSLRHGRGVHVFETTDGNLQAVKEMLRHKSIATAEIYVHLSPKATEAARSKLAKDFIPRDMD